MRPLISILIPVYNVQQYLAGCLESVCTQSYRNLEIILVDDGSTDGSKDVYEAYAQKDTRIRIIKQKNSGVAAARTAALGAASGEYLMYVDSDDSISENAVELMLARIQRDNSDLVIARHIHVFPDMVLQQESKTVIPQGTYSKDQILNFFGEGQKFTMAMWGKLFSRAVLEGIVFPPLRFGEDCWVFPEYISRCNTVSVMDDIVYNYYVRSGSITQTRQDAIRLDALKGDLHTIKFFIESGFMNSAKKRFSYAMGNVVLIRRKKYAREVIREALDAPTLSRIRRGQPLKVKLKWLSMYVPIIYPVGRAFLRTCSWLRGNKRN